MIEIDVEFWVELFEKKMIVLELIINIDDYNNLKIYSFFVVISKVYIIKMIYENIYHFWFINIQNKINFKFIIIYNK